jgi:hypothetical protein
MSKTLLPSYVGSGTACALIIVSRVAGEGKVGYHIGLVEKLGLAPVCKDRAVESHVSQNTRGTRLKSG